MTNYNILFEELITVISDQFLKHYQEHKYSNPQEDIIF
jgi:hypothetical protein